jgi:hypothetical protein
MRLLKYTWSYFFITQGKRFLPCRYLIATRIPNCQLLEQKLRILANKFKSTKFVKIRAGAAIPNYPDRNLPTLLIYNRGDVRQQYVGLAPFGGEKMTVEGSFEYQWSEFMSNIYQTDLEWTLSKTKAIQTDMDEDPRLSSDKTSRITLTRNYISRKNKDSDEEDDDD